MKNSFNISTGPALSTPFSSALEAVTAFATVHNLQRLTRVAEKRLNRLASQPPGQRLRGLKDPREFVNQAVALILIGQRKAAPRHLKSLDSFYNYIQAVVQSLITHDLESVSRQGEYVPLDSFATDSEVPVAGDVAREISLAETSRALFKRLRESASGKPEVIKAIDAWEESWTASDRIPKCNLTDKQVHDLRLKSRRFLLQVAIRDGITNPKEIL